ncbi:MAG TPA: EthD domain-containing protein [Egibacteraceae bacterium]
MITRIGMAPREEGLTLEEFQRHWRGPHGDVASRIPGVRSYVQNHAVLVDGRPVLPHPGFDACAQLTFDDLDAMDAAFASEHYQGAVRADERGFVDKTRFSLFLGHAEVLHDGRPGDEAVKLMTFLRAHPAVPRAELLAALRGPAAEAALADGAQRLELLTALDHGRTGREAQACDAVAIAWFADVDRALAHVRGPADDGLGGLVFGRERLLARPVRIL